MIRDESLIRQVRKQFEQKTGWGDSESWTNQDFLQLSEMIREQTGVTLSHVTLKRIWGKVRYDSLPNTHTLNTLVQYLGYESWREFTAKHEPTAGITSAHHTEEPATTSGLPATASPAARPRKKIRRIWILVPLTAAILLLLFFLRGESPGPQPQDYAFSSKKVVSTGVPNSVVFDYDARLSPDDSVVIQQSWDTTRRVKVSKNGHQYTSVYYYPDFFHATLQVHGRVVKTHNLLIESDGWLPIIEQSPVPVYFKKEEAMIGGKMTLPVEKIKEKNIPLQPTPPKILFCNVGDFGEIYSDHFVFETSLRNDYSEGSAVCQLTKVYLLCQGTAIWIPLVAKGCVSTVDLYFTYFFTSGRREDLSNFGVDFHNYVKLRVESDSGRARIFINDKLAYTVPRHILHSRIIGIDYMFEGTGSVDYVRLSNEKTNYSEDF